jgi:hypothetical protein
LLDNKEFVINALNFDEDKKIALGFRNAARASYKISVKQINFSGVSNVYYTTKYLMNILT